MLDNAFMLLCLQLEWGADEAIEAEPVDRLRPAPPRMPERVAPSLAAASLALPKGTPAERAVALADAAGTLAELRAAIADFDACPLRDTATNLVFAEGNAESGTLLIGGVPGGEEDRSGHPFAGAEGERLDQMLASIGLARDALLLTHLLPWRPPGGRPAHASELATCLPFLHRLIALSRPKRILLLGDSVGKALLPAGSVRRRPVREWTPLAVPGLPTSVPALLLAGLIEMQRKPVLKREAWAGLRLLWHDMNQA